MPFITPPKPLGTPLGVGHSWPATTIIWYGCLFSTGSCGIESLSTSCGGSYVGTVPSRIDRSPLGYSFSLNPYSPAQQPHTKASPMFQVIINTLIASLSFILGTDVSGVSAGPVLALSSLSPNDILLVRVGSASLVSARNRACSLDNTLCPSCCESSCCGIEEEVI